MPPSDPIVGIDLGTTNSLVAVCDARGPRVLAPEGAAPLVPSVVRIDADGAVAVGADARARAVEFPERTINSVKRLMGRGPADCADDLPHLGYAVEASPTGAARVRIDDRLRSPEEISAMILGALRDRAETALGAPVRRAVVTVPAYFDDAQRQATRDAGRLAGLEVVRIVNEPTAAALAYGIGAARTGEPETIAVYDLGGGTFDVSILNVVPPEQAGGEAIFQVLATAGDTHLGGDDVDRLIIDMLLGEIRARFGTTLAFPPATRQALRTFAEATKIRLSTESSALLRVDLGDGRIHERTLTRDELEAMATPWVERTVRACDRALRDAGLDASAIDRVVLVGGSTRMPLVRRRVAERFGAEPYVALDPDLVVALGASVQAAILAGDARDMLLLDVVPLSLGVETQGGAVAKIVMRNATVPIRATEMFSTSVDGQVNVRIHVLQGERELVRDCRSIAEFDLRGIPPMPAGIPQIQVEFAVDANGVLDVSAVERRSGRRAAVQVMPRWGLTREEVERIEAESFAHARADMHAHRVIDLAVNSKLDVKWTRDAMARVGDELPADLRAILERRIVELERFIAAAQGDPSDVDPDAFHRAKDGLDRDAMRLHEIAIARSLREHT